MYTITPGAIQKVVPHIPSTTFKVNYQIVHAIPGRIRFRVPLLALDQSYASRLENLLNNETHITKVRINRNAGSIAIHTLTTATNSRCNLLSRNRTPPSPSW
jgi:P-type Cu2+ transporter